MKKLLKIVLSVFMAMALAIQLPVNLVSVVNAEDGDIINEDHGLFYSTYTVLSDEEKTVELTKYYNTESGQYMGGLSESVVLPSVVQGYTVVSIAEDAFDNCGDIIEITIPASVTNIDDGAFSIYSHPQTFYVYSDSAALQYVTDNNFNYVILDEDTYNDDETELKYVDDEENIYYYYISSNNEITITYCRVVSANLTVPSEIDGYTVTAIEEYALEHNSSLVSITIPNTITNIGDGAFYSCTNLEEIIVVDGNTVYASLDGVLFSADKTILIYYPIGKTNTSYTVPDGVITIDEGAFENCNNLTSITISASVTSIEGILYEFSDNLESINVDEDNTVYLSVDGVLYDKDCTTLINYPVAKADSSYKIPDTVTTINYLGLWFVENLKTLTLSSNLKNTTTESIYLENLETLIIPSGLTDVSFLYLRYYGGNYCGNLKNILVEDGNEAYTSVDGVLFSADQTTIVLYPYGRTDTSYTIPTGVTTIGQAAFAFANLTSIEIPDTVTTIEEGAFYYSDITSFTIPISVTSIGDMAFFTSNVDYVTLYVYEGSYAHEYVKKYYLPEMYVVLENTTATVTPSETEKDGTSTTDTSTTSSANGSVQTGDESQLAAYALLAGIALLGVLYTRKKKYN